MTDSYPERMGQAWWRARTCENSHQRFYTGGLLKAHKNNLRGISVVVDEIAGMFKSTSRYSKNNILVEMLLSAWSTASRLLSESRNGILLISGCLVSE